jgi:superfamily II DNA/RNA helicase
LLSKAFRLFYEGKNVLINEMDGSGKTLAYVLPVLNRILYTKK